MAAEECCAAGAKYAAMKLVVFWALIAVLTLPAIAANIGTVAEAKAGQFPLFLWDATPIVTRIVATKAPRRLALSRLEAQAVDILAKKLTVLKDVKVLTMRLLYEKTGAVDPRYGSATFAGAERVFDLSVAATLLRTHAEALSKSLADGKVPSTVHLVVTGKLPPL